MIAEILREPHLPQGVGPPKATSQTVNPRATVVVLQIDFLLADTPVIYGAGGVLLYNPPLRRVRMTTLPEVPVQQRRGLLVGEDNFTG